MKSIIILGTILFVGFSAFGIATFIKTKQNHSLDKLYKPELAKALIIESPKRKIESEDFSRGEVEFTPPVNKDKK